MTSVRRFKEDELRKLAELRATWATGAVDRVAVDSGFLESFQTWLERNPRTIFVAEHQSQLVGMVNLMVFERMPKPTQEPSCWAYLSNAFVLPPYRNKGIGRELLRTATEYAEQIGAVRITLSPSEESISFYQRAGFRPADQLLFMEL